MQALPLLLLDKVLAPTPRRYALGATVLRVVTGAIFIGFGPGKFIHHGKEAASFDKYGLPFPGAFTYAIGTLELVCGALLIFGVATRLVAPALAGDMVGAISTGGRVDGGFINLGLAPILLVSMLVLIWAGAGRWSLDERVLRPRLGARPAGTS